MIKQISRTMSFGMQQVHWEGLDSVWIQSVMQNMTWSKSEGKGRSQSKSKLSDKHDLVQRQSTVMQYNTMVSRYILATVGQDWIWFLPLGEKQLNPGLRAKMRISLNAVPSPNKTWFGPNLKVKVGWNLNPSHQTELIWSMSESKGLMQSGPKSSSRTRFDPDHQPNLRSNVEFIFNRYHQAKSDLVETQRWGQGLIRIRPAIINPLSVKS